MSAFVLEDSVVYHTSFPYARGLDGLWGMYQWLDTPPRGATRRASGGAATANPTRFLKTPARVATRRMRAYEHSPLLGSVRTHFNAIAPGQPRCDGDPMLGHSGSGRNCESCRTTQRRGGWPGRRSSTDAT